MGTINLTNRGSDQVIRGNDLLNRVNDLVNRGNSLVNRGNDIQLLLITTLKLLLDTISTQSVKQVDVL